MLTNYDSNDSSGRSRSKVMFVNTANTSTFLVRRATRSYIHTDRRFCVARFVKGTQTLDPAGQCTIVVPHHLRIRRVLRNPTIKREKRARRCAGERERRWRRRRRGRISHTRRSYSHRIFSSKTRALVRLPAYVDIDTILILRHTIHVHVVVAGA